MALNIVTNYSIIGEIKNSMHFMMSLGFVSTIENNGSRSLNDKDKFSFFYNSQYNTTIYAQGSVGNIRFYTDHYISNDVLAVYTGDTFEEFIFDFDPALVREKGIDFYLGHILKETDLKHQERVEQNELRKMDDKPKGDASKIINNPGSVTYEDLKAYLEEQRKKRQL